MVFPIAGGNESKGYDISNSLRLNQGDSPVLTKTFSSAGTEETFTWSGWVKRGSDFGTRQVFFGADNAENSNASYIRFTDDETLQAYLDDGNSLESNLNTNAKFRDVSAWYHIVWAVDTTQGTDTNRVKVYVNGVQQTDFQSPVYPPQNFVTDINAANEPHYVATPTAGVGNDYALDGYITEVNFVDGSQLAPTSFGEFDDNGVWVPIKYTGTYGTNGFFLQFKQTGTSQNSSGIGADTSGNDNHFAVTNLAAQDITEDTCTNNFATLNSVDHRVEDATLSEGNCKFVGSNGNDGGSTSTIGVTSGKWYAEFKFLNNHKSRVGIIDQTGHDTNGNNVNDGVHYDFTGGYIYATLNGTGNDTGDNSTSGGYDVTDGSTNDILGVALDADNEKVLFTLNGTTLGQEGDGFTNLQRQNTGETFFFHVRDGSGSGDDEPQIVCNFGNPPPDFSISSGNTDGKYGNFEYAPPSGFYALCTKRLAEFG
jgi:hypothetical protein